MTNTDRHTAYLYRLAALAKRGGYDALGHALRVEKGRAWQLKFNARPALAVSAPAPLGQAHDESRQGTALVIQLPMRKAR